MIRVLSAAIAIVLAVPCAARAHRLDEYLQATRIALDADHVTIELDLTPGVAVAPQIFALIDRDRDGQVAAAEIEAYARNVLQDLTLGLDRQNLALTLTRAESPAWADMRDGLGTIRLVAAAAASLGAAGDHHLRYANAHQPEISVYLANALVPSTRNVAITSQQRDPRQRQFDVDITVAEPRTLYFWLALQGLAFVLLIAYRRGVS